MKQYFQRFTAKKNYIAHLVLLSTLVSHLAYSAQQAVVPLAALPEDQVTALVQSKQTIEQTIQNQFRQIQQIQGIRAIIFAIGRARMGKSTLLNFIAGRALTAEQDFATFRVNVDNPVHGINVGHTGEAETQIPAYVHIPESGIILYDCPGSNDPNTLNDLRNAYTFYTLFKLYSAHYPVKLLFVSTLDAATRPADSATFREALHTIAQTLLDNHHQVPQNLYLAFTQTDPNVRTTPDETLARIRMINIGVNIDNTPAALHIMINLHPGNFIFMPKPTRPGAFLADDAGNNALRSLFLRTLTVQEGGLRNLTPRLCPSNTAKGRAHRTAQDIHDRLGSLIRNTQNPNDSSFHNLVIDYFRNLITASTSAQGVRAGAIALRNIVLQPVATAHDFTNSITATLAAINQSGNPLLPQITRLIGALEVLCGLNDAINFQQAIQTVSATMQTTRDISQALTLPLSTTFQNNDLQIFGIFADMDEIIAALQAQNNGNNVRCMHIHILTTFYINNDFDRPGLSSCLIASCWKVIGQRAISLRGSNANNGQPAGQNLDGNQGHHGQHGGHFLGIVHPQKFLDSHLLSFDLSGGNAGRGSNGNQGTTGPTGNDATKSDSVISRTGPYWTETNVGTEYRKRYNGRHKDCERRCKETVTVYRGNDGVQGGTGGRPGAAGLVGNAGTFILLRALNLQANMLNGGHNQVTAQDGQLGSNGTPEQGGAGGAGGRNLRRVVRDNFEAHIFPQEGRDRGEGWVPSILRTTSDVENHVNERGNQGPQGMAGDGTNPIRNAPAQGAQAPAFTAAAEITAFNNYFMQPQFAAVRADLGGY